MESLKLIVFSVLVAVQWSSCDASLQFPSGFKFGAATAAFQIEGAWNASGKGESIWDRFSHRSPSPIKNNDTADVACDSYHQWERDIEMAADLGIHFYRFSIAWPRILPDGFTHNVSADGIAYYNNLIDGLIAKGIEPLVTLYHWDLPQKLQDYGGWLNKDVADLYANYTRVVFQNFGDRVKTWLTFNEPQILCDNSYNLGTFAPGIVDVDRAMYVCNKNILLAHAKAWRIYDAEFRSEYNGQVSIANSLVWFEGQTDDDAELAELANQYCNGRYTHPIYKGGWPSDIETLIANNSLQQGYSASRLPAFTEEEICLINGTWDFFGLNYYSANMIRKKNSSDAVGLWPKNAIPELGAVYVTNTNAETWSSSAFSVYPASLRYLLNWIVNQYGNISIFITENGYCSSNATQGALTDDSDRITYLTSYFEQVILAINEDAINVTAYTVWSLLDNFSWANGYSRKFGFYKTDYTNLTHYEPRASAYFFKELIANQTSCK